MERMARPRGDRKPGHRGLSLAASAQPLPGRKFCRVLSAGASLAILLNRKPGSAGAGRWRRERRTPSPRAPAGQVKARLASGHPEVPKPGRTGRGLLTRGWGWGALGGASSSPESTARLLPFAPRWTGAARSREEAAPEGFQPTTTSTTTRRTGKAKGGSPSESRKGPCADPGVGATVARVAGAMDAGHLLATGPSSRSRDPLRSPNSSLSLHSSKVGKEQRPEFPPHPAQDPALRWGSLPWELLSKFCRARLN